MIYQPTPSLLFAIGQRVASQSDFLYGHIFRITDLHPLPAWDYLVEPEGLGPKSEWFFMEYELVAVKS